LVYKDIPDTYETETIIGGAIVKIIEKYGKNTGKYIYSYVSEITKNIKK
jgi:hypothetical protein